MKPITFDLKKISKKKLVVMGDFMVDEYLQGDASRISPEAPVPVVHVKKKELRLGGAGNVVLNLHALGANVTAVSLLGDDPSGDWIVEQLQKIDADTVGIMRHADFVTSIKTRVTARNQQLLRYDREVIQDAPENFVEFLNGKIHDLLSDSCAVIISDYGKGVVTEKTAAVLIQAARSLGIPVIVDPKGSNYEKYRGATACTPNMKELQLAVGTNLYAEEDILHAGLELCARCNFEYVLATRSERGMSLIDGKTGSKKDYPALSKEVIDVTGAGDTVISMFTLCFALGASNDDCCRLANLAASVVVSKFGAAVATPEEIIALQHQDKISNAKLLSWDSAAEKVAQLKSQGKKIIFTNGCFDIVHAGHISSFRQAHAYGDILFLGLNSDASVKRNKGDNRPIVSQENRAALLEAISYIDYIVLFDEDTPEQLIHAIKPDVLVKGKDWEGTKIAGQDFVEKNGGQVHFIEMEEGLSTTNIIQKILNVYGNDTVECAK